MKVPYDILKKSDDGSMRWMEAVENLKQAESRAKELAQSSPGEYCIFDQHAQLMITMIRSKAAGWAG
jgi:hypothetical protein